MTEPDMEDQPTLAGTNTFDISVRALQETDLSAADHIMRLAFGTVLDLPQPAACMGDADYVRTRWRADPSAAFGARSATSSSALILPPTGAASVLSDR